MNPLLTETAQKNLVLASRSPRRFDLMTGLGFEFEVSPPDDDVENEVAHHDPWRVAEALARRKCEAVSVKLPASTVIAADTVVILDEKIFPKPGDDEEAKRFLSTLSGRTHTVVTGLAIQRRDDGVDHSGSEKTRVTFRDLSPGEIERYVATGEGRDKAGSYAAQGLGCGLIRAIDGCFYNVVGLPVALLFDMLRQIDDQTQG